MGLAVLSRCTLALALCLLAMASRVSSETETMGSITFQCPDGWKIMAPDCYLLVEYEMTFDNASNTCGKYGASLVHIVDEVEAKDVGNLVQQNYNKWKHYWIGNIVNGTEDVCTGFWDQGEPQDESGVTVMYVAANAPQGRWTGMDKETKLPSVCKTKACVEGTFRCMDSSKCLSNNWTCDGVYDCPDQSDENNCNSSCTHYLRQESGSLNENNGYRGGRTCTWAIEGVVGKPLSVLFSSVDLEEDMDYIEVWSGGPTLMTSTLQATLTGQMSNKRVLGINHFLIIRLVPDLTNQHTGFRATWEPDAELSHVVQEIVVTDAGAEIKSPYYMTQPPNVFLRQFAVSSNDGSHITMEVFENGFKPGFMYDKMTLSNVNDFGIFPDTYVSITDKFSFSIKSDGQQKTGTEFKAIMRKGCSVNMTRASGHIEPPNYSNNYPALFTCTYIVHAPQNEMRNYQVRFPVFELADSKDNIKIYNGTNSNSPMLSPSGGYTVGNPATTTIFLSTGPAFMVEFYSSRVQTKGFFSISFFLDCPAISNTDNMMLSTTNTSFETTVDISCDQGYSFAQEEFDGQTSVTLKCDKGGMWNNTRLPTCQVIYCGVPQSIQNGFITAGSGAATYGHNVTYQCFEGFTMSGSPVSRCGDGGEWSALPTCQASVCNVTQTPTNGNFNVTKGKGNDFGTIVLYLCDHGYDLVGSQYSLCQSNGTWSHTTPVCIPIKCPLPEVDHIATLSSAEPIKFKGVLTITCGTGFGINGQQSANFSCPSSGHFDVQQDACQDVNECSMSSPCSGGYETCINTEGSYTCECKDGFKRVGSTCVEISECDDDTDNCDDDHGLCNNCTGEPCTYRCECKNGYTLYTSNGTNEKYIPEPEDGTRPEDIYYLNHTCVPKTCQRPVSVPSTAFLLSNKTVFFYEDIVEYQCKFGYNLTGVSVRTCGADGQWTPTAPTCEPITCDPLSPTGLYRNVYPNATTSPGNAVMLECNSETGPPYNKTLYCAYDRETNSFRLQGDSPDCPAINCGSLKPTNGENYTPPASSGLHVSFTYSCIPGFQKMGISAMGNDTVECQRNGRWGLGNLTCEGKRCTDPGTPGGMEQVQASFEVDGLVEYNCTRAGYAPSARFLKCSYNQTTDTAEWNDTLPTCIDIEVPTFTNCPTSTVYLNLYQRANNSLPMPEAVDNSGLVLPLMVEPAEFELDMVLSQSVNVTYTSRDASGNNATCQIEIVVDDHSVLPTLTCPDYLILNVTSTTSNTYDLKTVVTAEAGTTVTYSEGPVLNVSSALVGKQPTPVRVTATNRFGFRRQCAFLVETKATTCLRTFIESDISTKNSNVQCQNSTGSGNLTCTVTCKTNYTFQDGQTTATYSCSGENVWSPSLPVRFCVELTSPHYQYLVTVLYTLNGSGQISACQPNITAALTASIPTRTTNCFTSAGPNDRMAFKVQQIEYTETAFKTMKAKITLRVANDTSTISNNLLDNCKSNLNVVQQTGSMFVVDPNTCGSGKTVTAGAHDSGTTGDFFCDDGSVHKDIGSNQRCVPCEPGNQYNGSHCVPCENGKYQDLAGQSNCTACKNGASFSREPRLSSSQCVAPCPPGFEDDKSRVPDPGPCRACQEDQYKPADAYSSSCLPCLGSKTTSGVEGAVSASQCEDKCGLGRYPVNTTQCQPCPTGFYKDSENNTVCNKCADNETTTGSPASSPASCVAITETPTCENGGTVVARNHKKECDCPEGYYGDTCERMVDRCASSPCYNGGTCSPNGPDNYTCLCLNEEICEMVDANIGYDANSAKQLNFTEGLTEKICKQNCLDSNTCYSAVYFASYGGCVLYTESNTKGPPKAIDSTTFKKSCDIIFFFNGTNCENDVRNDCTNDTCAEREFCRDKIDYADCVCPSSSKYTQPRCDTDLSLCSPNPCKNGATCEDSGSGVRYICVCPPGYTGKDCEVDINKCEENPDGCLYGQQCVDGVSSYSCQCGNYSGDHCQKLADFCSVPGTCNNGLCYNDYNTSMAVCVCEFPYRVGADGQCEEMDICGENTLCENNSTCQRVSPGQYKCLCPTGYTGFHCQHDIDDCSPNPCQNGGLCTDRLDSYNCSCARGYEGDQCQTLIDMCLGQCAANGTNHTMPVPNDCQCFCKPGFTGVHCELDIDECLSLPCQHGGTCTNSNTPNNYTCTCRDGWTGKNCEMLLNFCTNTTCDNSGTCLSLQDDFFCQCKSGTYGRKCQTATDVCNILNPCASNSTCEKGGGTAKCSCPTNYTGSSCHLIEDSCSKMPCANDGKCVTNTVGFTCECDDPYSGPACGTKANACDTAGCPSDSTCEEKNDTTLCLCEPGKLPNGTACKEMNNNFDIYFSQASDAIMSYQPFRVDSTQLTLALWMAPLDEPSDKPVQLKLSNGSVILAVGNNTVYFGDEEPVQLKGENDDDETFDLGKWNLFAVTWNSSGNHQLYLNSLQLKEGTSAGFPALNELVYVYIGESLHGYFSQLSVWNRTLDYPEILTRVYSDPLSVPQSGLVLKWSGYKPNLWTRIITPSTVQADRTVCEGGKHDIECDGQTDKNPPAVTSECPTDDEDKETQRLVQLTALANPDTMFSDGQTPVSNINGTLLTFGAHRIVYMSKDDDGNVALCRFNAYVRRQGQSCSNKQGLNESAVSVCGSSGALTVTCPNNKVPLFTPKKLTCGKLGSFNLDNQYRLPPGLLCGATSKIVYKAKMTLKYKLIINCTAGNEPDMVSNLKIKMRQLRQGWPDLCPADSNCGNADVTTKCNSSGSPFITASITLTGLPALINQTSTSVRLTPKELLETASLELGSFTVSNVAGATLQTGLVVIVVTPSCQSGYGLFGDSCVACEGGSYLNETAGTCMPCEIGTYTDHSGQTACLPCGSGKTTLQSGSTKCDKECAVGKYLDLTDDICKDCPKNFYQPLSGQIACLPCPAGKISENPGTVSISECFDTCPAGEQLDDAVCVKCPRGTYRDGIDMEVCGDCASGTTTPTVGATSSNQCSQMACPPGQMHNSTANTCMYCDYGYYQPDKWQDSCLKCNASYTTENQGTVNASQCRFVCQAGSEDSGNNTCQPCQPGYYRTGSLEDRFQKCSKCNDSFTTDGATKTSPNDCNIRICLAGHYRNATNNMCYKCPFGLYQPASLQTACERCLRNLTTSVEGAENKTQCVFYCTAGYQIVSADNETCSPCPRGKFKTIVGDAKFQACQACPAQKTTDSIASVSQDFCNITVCAAGQFVTGTGCSDCPVDTYQSVSPPFSYTQCQPCDQGFGTQLPKQTSNTSCLQVCPAGQQLNLTTKQCEDCPQGTYNTGNQTDRFHQCHLCPTGYVTHGIGATHVDNCTLRDCPAGTFINSTDCSPCPVGKYQDMPRQTSCKLCPTNTNTSGPGSDELSDCTTSCPAGQEQKNSSSLADTCGLCENDFYKPDGPGKCLQCTGNVTSNANRTVCSEAFCDFGFKPGSGNDCVACEVGTYKGVRGNTSCTPCPTNTTTATPASTNPSHCSMVHCDLGLYAPGDTAPCLPCPAGTYKNETGNQNCTACLQGFTTVGMGSIDGASCSLVVCPPGQFRNASNQCHKCGYGKYQNESGQTSCESCPAGYSTDNDTSISQIDCKILCDAGQYRASRTMCQPCAVSTYQNQNQSSVTSCVVCDPGFTTAMNGSTAASDCYKICSTGEYLLPSSQNTCQPCHVGSYQSNNGSRNCVNCSTGFTTLSTRSNDMQDCQPICGMGEYLDPSQHKCEKCPLGTYNPTAATSTAPLRNCTRCPDKKTTLVTGAININYCNVTDCDRGEMQKPGFGCVECEKGTYQPLKSQVACEPCAAGKTTILPGRIFVNACVEECGEGKAWNAVNQSCETCSVGYIRKVHDVKENDTESCTKCPAGYTTLKIGASECVPSAAGVTPSPVRKVTIKTTIRIRIKSCTNKLQIGGVIIQFITNIVLKADAQFAALCEGSCINLKITFKTGCLKDFRQRRQAPSTENQDVEVELQNVPDEISGVLENGAEVTQQTQDVVTRAFDNYQVEQNLLDNNELEFVAVTSALTSPECQAGQYTSGDTCENCAPGFYSPFGTNTSCTPCPPNEYQNQARQASCLSCPEKTYTTGKGSNSSTDCKWHCDEPNSRAVYCSDHGKCVRDSTAANGVKCECDDKYTGKTCGIRESPDDSDKMSMIGGIIGGVAGFLFILLLIFGIVTALRRSAKGQEKKGSRKIKEEQMSEGPYSNYNYPLFDSGAARGIGYGPAIMYVNPAADEDVREFYQSDRDSARASRKRSQSYETAWQDLPTVL